LWWWVGGQEINKHCYMLHLVGFDFYGIANIEDARSNTNQIQIRHQALENILLMLQFE
jgi:hypothetical protein